jgi:hypothetical protein
MPYTSLDGHRAWQREAIELKAGPPKKKDPLEKGLQQLGAYLDRLGLDHGILVLFDRRPDIPPIEERIYFEGATTPRGQARCARSGPDPERGVTAAAEEALRDSRREVTVTVSSQCLMMELEAVPASGSHTCDLHRPGCPMFAADHPEYQPTPASPSPRQRMGVADPGDVAGTAETAP